MTYLDLVKENRNTVINYITSLTDSKKEVMTSILKISFINDNCDFLLNQSKEEENQSNEDFIMEMIQSEIDKEVSRLQTISAHEMEEKQINRNRELMKNI